MFDNQQYTIKVDDVQRRILIHALEHLKHKQIEQNKQYDAIDDIILKMCDAEMQKSGMRRPYHEER